jgi:peptidoglycan/LPS O-acetylase OafA/YrhL
MKLGTSLYLDLSRFSAALVVFLGHAAGQSFTGGLFWQVGSYLQTAVMVFFVMSGYVIAHVLATRETDLLQYTAARFGRIYSIAIPALLLTWVCDSIGLLRSPDFYHAGPWGYPAGDQTWRYIATMFMVNRWWIFGSDLEPGINVPFWSLSFEATYYIAIAIFIFSDGIRKYVILGLLAILAGPSIVFFAPIWILGYATYQVSARWRPSAAIGAGLFLAGAALILISPWLRKFQIEIPGVNRGSMLGDYGDALGFALTLIGLNGFHDRVEFILKPWETWIRAAGNLTFALYLFHRPLIQVLAVYPLGEPASWQQRMWVLGGVFAVVLTIGRACEAHKVGYRRVFLRCSALFRVRRA